MCFVPPITIKIPEWLLFTTKFRAVRFYSFPISEQQITDVFAECRGGNSVLRSSEIFYSANNTLQLKNGDLKATIKFSFTIAYINLLKDSLPTRGYDLYIFSQYFTI